MTTRIATADQYQRAQKLSADSGHSLSAALDIIVDRDRKQADAKARGVKAVDATRDWAQIPIHGLIPIADQEALADPSIMPFAEELFTGKAPAASEAGVEQEVIAYLFGIGGAWADKAGDAIQTGQLLIDRTSQAQKPIGMTKGISDLLLTRHGVWTGWFAHELKARGKNGKIDPKAKIYPEQQARADVGLLTIGWHTVHVAVMVFTLDRFFGWPIGKSNTVPPANRSESTPSSRP